MADTFTLLGAVAFGGAFAFGGAVSFGWAVVVFLAGGVWNEGMESRWAFSIADGLLSKKALICISCSSEKEGALGGPSDVLLAE